MSKSFLRSKRSRRFALKSPWKNSNNDRSRSGSECSSSVTEYSSCSTVQLTDNLTREWINIKKPGPNCNIFTLMSYNILSDRLLQAHKTLYQHARPAILLWKNRWERIHGEIKCYSPSVISLQEVQNDHYLKEILPSLNSLGYEGFYTKRTGNNKYDGCAIFYKRSEFILNDSISVQYNQNIHRILDRDNIGLIAKLEFINSGKNFIVASTHLLFNPKRSDIRTYQSILLLAELDRISYLGICPKSKTSHYLPTVVTGDFNCSPCSKEMLFWKTGKTELELDFKKLGISKNCTHEHVVKDRTRSTLCSPLIKHTFENPNVLQLQPYELQCQKFEQTHGFCFRSIDYFDGVGRTTLHDDWLRVDYIMYSLDYDLKEKKYCEGQLHCLAVLKSPEEPQCRPMPNEDYPSDHISQIAEFSLSHE